MLRIAVIHLLLLQGLAKPSYSQSSSSSSSSPSPSSAGIPLFDYETVQLTDDSLRHIDIPSHLSGLFPFNTTGPTLKRGECKPLPGDANWPTDEKWEALNKALGGEVLVKTVPLAARCYKEWAVYNEDQCEELKRDWADPWLHEDDATSVMSPLWQGLTCLPPGMPSSSPVCTLGGYPSYAINATTVSHIQLGVNFARNNGIRLVIKNTGHDSLGKSCGAGALSIWTRPAADHILAINIVTADGHFRTVTEETYPDLFWAIRGGGGGIFGITTSIIVRLHEKLDVTTSQISFQTSDTVDDDTFWLGVRAYLENFERHGEAGFYAYFNILRNEDGASYSMSIQSIVAPNTSLSAFNVIIQPFLTRLDQLNISYQFTAKQYSSFLPALREAWPSIDRVTAFFGTWGSRFFPAQIWTDPNSFSKSFSAIRKVSQSGYALTAWQMAPGNPMGANNAVNPAMRHALAFFAAGAAFPDSSTPAEKLAVQNKFMADVIEPWRAVAPISAHGGSYLNLANSMDPHWREDYYGQDNYAKLKEIKDRWDPGDLFYALTGVRSEDWEVRTEEQGIQTQNGPLCRRADEINADDGGHNQVVLEAKNIYGWPFGRLTEL
ncbi:fad fmn-containing isoamyl alcohol oxidase [Trichoderma arundinaceum]|uniref:Fad fmn-containing isoamyl alcohol oxidase n=1 Tax=Trichoderma arundinaceum TaxID=490622 RepID=A0A395NH78_TRIAR|nr:fad fmn-containing isoamyl alcohol oxidase [Trichoderma arundinaceum]